MKAKVVNSIGEKVQKKVTNGTNIKTTDYLDGFQYNQQVLEFFPHAEGYVKATNFSLGGNPNYAFNYVYNYTDHLGNVRLSYAKDPQTGNLKILDESHYYPFGLKHQEYQANGFTTNPIQGVIIAPVANNPFKYAFNNIEWQDELDLNMYDMDMRQYDPAIARWVVMDPVIHHSMSLYNAFDNNPVFWADPSGAAGEHYNWDNGKYEDDKGNEVTFEVAMASQGLNPDGTQKEDQEYPIHNTGDISIYKGVQVMEKLGKVGKVLKYLECNNLSDCKRTWTGPDGFTTYTVNDDGFIDGVTITVIGGAGSLEYIGGGGVLILKLPKYLKNLKRIKTTKDLLSYGVRASESFELLRTGGRYKAVIEGGTFGAGQYYIQLIKEGWQAIPLNQGGFKLIKEGSEIFFRSSKSGGYKALDTFTLPKAYNGKNVDLFFK